MLNSPDTFKDHTEVGPGMNGCLLLPDTLCIQHVSLLPSGKSVPVELSLYYQQLSEGNFDSDGKVYRYTFTLIHEHTHTQNVLQVVHSIIGPHGLKLMESL